MNQFWRDARIIEQIELATAKDATLEPILAFFKNDLDEESTNIRQSFKTYCLNNGLIYFQDTIFVRDNEELRAQILQSRHDAPATRHRGREIFWILWQESFIGQPYAHM